MGDLNCLGRYDVLGVAFVVGIRFTEGLENPAGDGVPGVLMIFDTG